MHSKGLCCSGSGLGALAPVFPRSSGISFESRCVCGLLPKPCGYVCIKAMFKLGRIGLAGGAVHALLSGSRLKNSVCVERLTFCSSSRL